VAFLNSRREGAPTIDADKKGGRGTALNGLAEGGQVGGRRFGTINTRKGGGSNGEGLHRGGQAGRRGKPLQNRKKKAQR